MVDLSPATSQEDVSQAAAAAVAAVAQAVLAEQQQQHSEIYPVVPPQPLPPGWVVKSSQSQPDCVYYYNYETGVSTWQRPALDTDFDDDDDQENEGLVGRTDSFESSSGATNDIKDNDGSSKRPLSSAETMADSSIATAAPPAKRSKSTAPPKQVRVLHILKKHKDSRKPSSWRAPTITQSLQDARDQVQELLNVLLEVKDHPEELRATFEELARTESDCSSAKRGGDLGFFGPKKMQPAFEKASFALDIGEMSGLVETSSGVHVILRIG